MRKSEIGRWNVVDSLATKNSHESPYFVKEIASMYINYNKYLNGVGLNVPDSGYMGDAMKIDFPFKYAGTVQASQESAKNDMEAGYSIGNSFTVVNDGVYPRLKTKELDNDSTFTSTVVGVTFGNNGILMNSSKDIKINRVHALIYTLGFDHPKGMDGTSGIIKYPPEKLNQANVNQVPNGSFLPVIILKSMKKSSLSILLLLMVCFASKSQTYNCPLINDTLYYISFDIRSATNNPISMSGVSKSSEVNKFIRKDVTSFINSFYSNHFFVPDLFEGHKKMIMECLGRSMGEDYLKKNHLVSLKIINNLSKKSINKRVVLESGETVFLNVVKIYGSFWKVNKNSPGIISSSNEIDIKDIQPN